MAFDFLTVSEVSHAPNRQYPSRSQGQEESVWCSAAGLPERHPPSQRSIGHPLPRIFVLSLGWPSKSCMFTGSLSQSPLNIQDRRYNPVKSLVWYQVLEHAVVVDASSTGSYAGPKYLLSPRRAIARMIAAHILFNQLILSNCWCALSALSWLMEDVLKNVCLSVILNYTL